MLTSDFTEAASKYWENGQINWGTILPGQINIHSYILFKHKPKVETECLNTANMEHTEHCNIVTHETRTY